MANEVYQLKVNGKDIKLGKGPNAEDEFTSFKDLKISVAKTMSLPDAVHLLYDADSKEWQLKVTRPETVQAFVLQERRRNHSNRYFYTGYEAAHSATKGGNITGIQFTGKTSLKNLLMRLFPITIEDNFISKQTQGPMLYANYVYNQQALIETNTLGDDGQLIFGMPPGILKAMKFVDQGVFDDLVVYIKFCSNFKITYNSFVEENNSYAGTAFYSGMFNKTGLKITFTKNLLTVDTYSLTI